MIIALVLLGLAATGAGIAGLLHEMTRAPTGAELAAAAKAAKADRWRRWPPDKIFPAVLDDATRLGAVQQTTCDAVLDTEKLPLARKFGCRGAVRATYADSSGLVVGTVVVLSMRDPTAASEARFAGNWLDGGVRALTVPGTLAHRFGDAQRQGYAVDHRGSYLVLSTAGFADGRGSAEGEYEDMPGSVIAVEDLAARLDVPCPAKEPVEC